MCRRGGTVISTCPATVPMEQPAMAPSRPCAAGRTREAGFTLTELLVVLAIIGLLVAAVPILMQSAMPGARTLAAAQGLAQDLRIARGQAIASGSATVVRFDA